MDPDFNGTVVRYVLVWNPSTEKFTVTTYIFPAGANPNAVIPFVNYWEPGAGSSTDFMEANIATINDALSP